MTLPLVAALLACGPADPEQGTSSPAPAPAPTEAPAPTPAPQPAPTTSGEPVDVRFATFNVSLYGTRAGEIAELLGDPAYDKAIGIASILQEVRPDVVVLNEIDAEQAVVERLRDAFLAVGQGGRDPLDYPYVYVAPSNTGLHSGLDLDNNGTVDAAREGTADYAGDSFGYGAYPGQYGFAVLSRYPLGTPRTFQAFLWADMPDADLPPDWYDADELVVMRLSSKNHVDLPVDIDGRTVHFLLSHPTPPTFDGDEDRNGRRNHDEIRFWADYVTGDLGSYHIDDAGLGGALSSDAHFVIAGDLNADPHDGDSRDGAINQLLDHPRVQSTPIPASDGGAEQAELQGDANRSHVGDPANDTTDFEDTTVGNLRIDYVLPSDSLVVRGSGVFWPTADDPDFPLVGTFPFPVSDHRAVWLDLTVPAP